MRKERIVILGSTTIDLIFKSKLLDKRKRGDRLSLALGGKYLADEFHQLFGGGGANAAVSLTKQGFKPILISQVSKDDVFADLVIDNLKKHKVNTTFVTKTASATQISAILVTAAGERTIVNYRSDADLIKLSPKIKGALRKGDWFVIFSMARLPKQEKLKFLKIAKKAGLKIFLSLHGEEYFKGLNYLKDYFKMVDIVQMNAHECADIFGGNAPDFNFYKTNFAKKLKLPLLVVSYDIHGSFAYTQDKIYYQDIVKEKRRVDTTGAGDAFSSGFLGKYIKTGNIQKSLYFGNCNATSIIEHLGAQNVFLKDP